MPTDGVIRAANTLVDGLGYAEADMWDIKIDARALINKHERTT